MRYFDRERRIGVNETQRVRGIISKHGKPLYFCPRCSYQLDQGKRLSVNRKNREWKCPDCGLVTKTPITKRSYSRDRTVRAQARLLAIATKLRELRKTRRLERAKLRRLKSRYDEESPELLAEIKNQIKVCSRLTYHINKLVESKPKSRKRGLVKK